MDTTRYVLAVLVVITLPPALLYWFIVHPFVEHWRRLGPAWTISIVSAFLLLVMGLLWVNRAALLGTDYGTNWSCFICGLLVEALAWALGFIRQKQLSMRVLVGVPELEASGASGKLLQTGIYARVRNPRYLEVFIGTLGFSLCANYLGGYVTVLLSIPVLQLIVLMEEKELRQRFGEEYAEYCRRVPRWIPLLGRSAVH
ncbi:MAG: methyltransferase family protein [Planctomycetota bacterium]|jgi:protein-S-isoprenylcysteine O-methyltransferase Ste14